MFIIGITGGTGSGKTTIINKINKLFDQSNIGLLSSDSYYKDNSNLKFSERDNLNYDSPDAIDFDLLNNHIRLLKMTKILMCPTTVLVHTLDLIPQHCLSQKKF